MEELNLTYNGQYQVVICRVCGIALTGKVDLILGHLQKRHDYHISTLPMKNAKRELKGLTLNQSHDIPELLPSSTQPVDGLSFYEGFTCVFANCPGFISKYHADISKHCRTAHHLRSSQRIKSSVRRVQLQTFFRTPQRFFIVEDKTRANSHDSVINGLGEESIQASSPPTQVETDFQKAMQAHSAIGQTIPRSGDNLTLHPWFRRTGIHGHLAGLEKDRLLQLVSLDTDKPGDVLVKTHTIKAILTIANATLAGKPGDRLSRQARQILKEHDQARYARGFQRVQQDSTYKLRYGIEWARLIMFVLRLFDGEGNFDLLRQWKTTLPPGARDLIRHITSLLPSLAEGQESMDNDSLAEVEALDTDIESCHPEEEFADLEHLQSLDQTGFIPQRQASVLRKAITQLSISLVRHSTKSNDFRSLIVSFAAVRSLNDKGAFLNPQNQTSFFSGMIHIMKLWLFQYSLEETERRYIAHAWTEETQIEILKSDTAKYLREEGTCPCVTLNTWRALAKSTIGDFTPIPLTTLAPDMQSITHNDIKLPLDDFRSMLQQLIIDARAKLQQHLMFGTPNAPYISTAEVRDSPNRREYGFSFVDVPENQQLRDQQDGFRKHVWNTTDFREGFLSLPSSSSSSSSSQPQRSSRITSTYNNLKIQQYLDIHRQFLFLLSLLFYFTGGLPPRGPELLSAQWCNSETPRQIYIYFGQVVIFATPNTKSGWLIGVRPVARWLPAQVSDLYINYIVFVRPIVIFFLQQLSSTTPFKGMSFLFAPPFVSPHNWSARLGSEMKQRLGVSLKVSSWRHMIHAIDRACFHVEHAGVLSFDPGAAEEGDDMFDDEKEGIHTRALGAGLQDIHALQASHSATTASRVYGNSIDLTQGMTDEMFDAFRRVSKVYHEWFNLSRPDKKRLRSSTVLDNGKRPLPAWGSALIIRRSFWDWTACQAALESLFGKKAQPKTNSQRVAIQLVASCKAESIIVLPTGGGKTILFTLPTLLPEAQVTVVVIPLVALRLDLIRRCREWNIDVGVWEENPVLHRPRNKLIIISAESVITDSFLAFARALERYDELDRFILDEAHLVLTAEHYRPVMTMLRELRSVMASFTCLTATLPPIGVAFLKDSLLMTMANEVRQSADRHNLKYEHVMVKPKPGLSGTDIKEQVMIRAVQLAVSQIEANDRVLCFARTKASVRDMAQKLDAFFYYSDLDERENYLTRWIHGGPKSSRVMVATNGLGAGLDYPHIRHVFHFDAPGSLLEYAQETGRAGRDNRLAICTTFLRPNAPNRWKPDMSAFMIIDQKKAANFFKYQDCLRLFLTSYLDGDTGTRCPPDDPAMCSNCPGYTAMLSTSTSVVDIHSELDSSLHSEHKSSMSKELPRICPPSPAALHFSLPVHSSPSSSRMEVGLPDYRGRPSTNPLVSSPLFVSSPPRFKHRVDYSQHESGGDESQDEEEEEESYTESSAGFNSPPAKQIVVQCSPSRSYLQKAQLRHTLPQQLQSEQLDTETLITAANSARVATQDKQTYQARFQQLLDQWRGMCIRCSFAQSRQVPDCGSRCQSAVNDTMTGVNASDFKFAPYSACFSCGIPQEFCGKRRGGSGASCTYPHILKPVLFTAMWYDRDSCNDILRHLGKGPITSDIRTDAIRTHFGWFGTKKYIPGPGKNGIEGSNAAHFMLLWLDRLSNRCKE